MAKKTPLRKCVGCGEMIAKKDMLRVIRKADGEVKIDFTGKEPNDFFKFKPDSSYSKDSFPSL